MPELVQHLDLFDEILQLLAVHIAFVELFDGHFGTEPACFVYIAIAAAADDISLLIDDQLIEIYIEVKAILVKRSDQSSILTESN